MRPQHGYGNSATSTKKNKNVNKGMVEDGRKCWQSARERERLRARFSIRERVLGSSTEFSIGKSQCDMESVVLMDSTENKEFVANCIRFIKAGDRSKFSLSQLDRKFEVVSSEIPIEWLRQPCGDKGLDSVYEDSWAHSLQLCTAWFGEGYANDLDMYWKSLETFTLLEYATWMGKFSVVGALLLAGLNPCFRGRQRSLFDNVLTKKNEGWSPARMGIRVRKRFFDCFPLTLSTYIVKRVIELRMNSFRHQLDQRKQTKERQLTTSTTTHNHPHECDHCQQPTTCRTRLLWDDCNHVICEGCFWTDFLENIDARGELEDVVLCPQCGGHNKEASAENALPTDPNLSSRERGHCSFEKFQALPSDRKALKDSSSKRRKKKLSESEQWAPSWNQAVLPSLGSTQNVRQDKFFSFVEQNAVHYVRGCLVAGVRVDWTNEYGQTALYVSAWKNYVEVASLLLDYGANPYIAPLGGSIPLRIAQWHRHFTMVQLLLSASMGIPNPDSTHHSANLEAWAKVFASLPSSQCPVRSELISSSEDHPGAGSCTIDKALSTEQVDALLCLHQAIPYDPSQKRTEGKPCSERSYYCDATGTVARALETAVHPSGLHQSEWDGGRGANLASGGVTGSVKALAHMRFLHYSVAGTSLNPHVDICRVDPCSGRRSTHTFIAYLTDCPEGGETSLLKGLAGEERSRVLACVSPARGRLLLFPHACPHEGNEVRDLPKILLRGEMILVPPPGEL